MQSVSEVTNDSNLVPADVLRGMTMSKEALAEQRKNSILETFMSSMVKMATEQGGKSYAAQFTKDFDSQMLNDIRTEFSKLGYNVTTELKTDSNIGEFQLLTVSW